MSELWPFSKQDWNRVSEAARSIVNASCCKDPVLRQSCCTELFQILSELREKHGGHPVLFETEADYTDDPKGRIELYRQAIAASETAGLQTLSIRISLAEVLIETFSDRNGARVALLACERELDQFADAYDRERWSKLLADVAGGAL